MAVATTTALLIAAGASAGAQAYGAKKGSDAAKDAANTQADSSDKAMAQAKEIYDQQRRDQEPYRNTGTAALSALSSRMGLNVAPPSAMPAAAPAQAQPAARPTPTLASLQSTGAPQGNFFNPQHRADVRQFHDDVRAVHGQMTAGGNEIMRTQDGRTISVPPDKVNEAIQRGARRA